MLHCVGALRLEDTRTQIRRTFQPAAGKAISSRPREPVVPRPRTPRCSQVACELIDLPFYVILIKALEPQNHDNKSWESCG